MGVGLVTFVVEPMQFPDRWKELLGGVVLSVIFGIFWTILGWRLDEIQRIAIRDAPHWVDDEAVWKEIIKSRNSGLIILWLLAVLCCVGAFGLLLATSKGASVGTAPIT